MDPWGWCPIWDWGFTPCDGNRVELCPLHSEKSVVFTLLQTSLIEESVGSCYSGRRVTKVFHERSYCLKKNKNIYHQLAADFDTAALAVQLNASHFAVLS